MILNSYDPMKIFEYISKHGLDLAKATEDFALKPDKFSAVYFPAWFVYASLRSLNKPNAGLIVNRAYVKPDSKRYKRTLILNVLLCSYVAGMIETSSAAISSLKTGVL